jgi:hypothetical protein
MPVSAVGRLLADIQALVVDERASEPSADDG